MTLTEEERGFVYSLVNDVFQNYNTRTMEPEGFVESILSHFQSNVVVLSQRESRFLQTLLQRKSEVYSRLADQRLQHILCSQNNQGFGMDHGSKENYFNGPKTYLLCQAVLKKLVGS